MGWAWALERVAEPADIWHGMWAGSLPALERMRRRHGGRTIYDSRDVYMHSRDFARAGWPVRDILAWFERRWARSANVVLTVNGKSVEKPDAAHEVWSSLKTAPSIEVAYLRDGKKQSLKFAIADD